MILKKIHIEKFHGFRNVGFNLGKNITIIAGQNGTQKTTLLGLMSQAFTIGKNSEMRHEKPLCGGSYKSAFADKFKLSSKYDIAGDHEWTLSFFSDDVDDYTVASMYRHKSKGNQLRFWKKGSRGKGTGYAQYPVIYLSLKRLTPLGEEPNIKEKFEIEFEPHEIQEFKKHHNNILFTFDNILETTVVESPNKTTLGINTDLYDWTQNSAGQDNLGKILLALMSFKRLHDKHKKAYKGGLLFIDELDATMYPGSQRKLLETLMSFSSKYRIQIVFTTHSLTLLKLGYHSLQKADANPATKDNIQIIYLEKKDNHIEIFEKFPYSAVENRLQNITSQRQEAPKIRVFSEDQEAVTMAKALLNKSGLLSRLDFTKYKFGNGNLINILQIGVQEFKFPNSIILFDGDVSVDNSACRNLKKIKGTPNWIFLPSMFSPEVLLANYLNNLSDNDPLWENIWPDYNRTVCFDTFKPDKILDDREVAKLWFQEQSAKYKYWCLKIIKSWMKSSKENEMEVKKFIGNFVNLFNDIASEIRIPLIKK